LKRKHERLEADIGFQPFTQWVEAKADKFGNQLFEGPVNMEVYFDFIGRFERLREDFQTVCERLGFKATLPHVNRSDHAPYTSYYDDRSRVLVAERCAYDIERFGYRFGAET
jgi:hypothetical protein